jgi:hypothetical protein
MTGLPGAPELAPCYGPCRGRIASGTFLHEAVKEPGPDADMNRADSCVAATVHRVAGEAAARLFGFVSPGTISVVPAPVDESGQIDSRRVRHHCRTRDRARRQPGGSLQRRVRRPPVRDLRAWRSPGRRLGPGRACAVRIVNHQFAPAGTRLYAINADNDLLGIVMTPWQAERAKAGIAAQERLALPART